MFCPFTKEECGPEPEYSSCVFHLQNSYRNCKLVRAINDLRSLKNKLDKIENDTDPVSRPT